MKFLAKGILTITFLLLAVVGKSSGYEIYGTITNHDSLWGDKIYLAVVDPDETYWSVSEDQIVNEGVINDDGTFSIKGINLPDTKVICRLYLTKPHFKVQFQSEPANYSLLVMDNNSIIEISADWSFDPGKYQVSGDFSEQNNRIKELGLLEISLRENLKDFETGNALDQKLGMEEVNSGLRSFCENSEFPLVDIITTHDISEFEEDYMENRSFYLQLLNKMKAGADSSSQYVVEFEKKLEVIDFKNGIVSENTDQSKPQKSNYIYLLIISVLITLLAAVVVRTRIKSKRDRGEYQNQSSNLARLSTLTRREREVFELLKKGYQNKEIANELNLSVSTIKTHVSSLFRKLKISRRSELNRFLD